MRYPATRTHNVQTKMADAEHENVAEATESAEQPSEEPSSGAAVQEEQAGEEGQENTAQRRDEPTPADGKQPEEQGAVPPEEGGQGESVETAGEGGEAVETEQPAGEEQEEVKATEETIPEEDPDEALPIPENEAIPESDEGPVMEVGQRLSREGSPIQEEQPPADIETKDEPDPLATPPPASPPPEEQELEIETAPVLEYDEQEIDDESEPEVPIYNRAELIERYHQAMEERSQLQALNAQLQHKLAEYFRKKKSDERQQEMEKNVTDQEQRYLKYMSNLEDLQAEEKRELESYKAQIEELKEKCVEKQEAVSEASDKFMVYKYDVAKQAINSRSGKPIPPKDLEQYQSAETKKEQEVIQVRLENIKLKNRLKKREMQLKAKEELAEGLHLIDFEQLKIENQTYNEKIEERNEELLKLRKKITTTVQVLTHLKEKLQFVQAENGEQRTRLRAVEAQAAQKRDILTRTKQVRDALRIENVKLRQKSGLLGNEPLLRDYEIRKEQSDQLRAKIEQLKMSHAELTMDCTGVKKKIDQARDEKPL